MSVLSLVQPQLAGLWALRGRLPNAILLHGPRGIGKSALARAYGAALLCSQTIERGIACGECPACRLVQQGHHPDFRVLEPESAQEAAEAPDDGEDEGSGEALRREEKKRSRQILVGQVRALQDKLHVGSHQGGLTVVIVDPADAMNANTANALLKTLEEPPDNLLFILVSDSIHRLLPTVLSRTLRVPVELPERTRSEDWLREEGVQNPARLLAVCGGLPTVAARLAGSGEALLDQLEKDLQRPGGRDAIPCAAFWESKVAAAQKGAHAIPDLDMLVGWMQRWVHDLWSIAVGGSARFFPSAHQALQATARQTEVSRLLSLERTLRDSRRLAQHPLNTRLYLETLFIQYAELFTR